MDEGNQQTTAAAAFAPAPGNSAALTGGEPPADASREAAEAAPAPRPRRGGGRATFFLRAAAFAVLAALLVGYATFVLTPKYDYGICSMMNLYRQPENTVDVLVVGTSLAYAGVNTNVLWREFGIACYNLCSAEQPFWAGYYMLREALKTQRPRVILLDAKPAIYTRDYSSRQRTILSCYGIRGIENRVGAIFACVQEKAEAQGFLLGIPEVHNRYPDVSGADFALPPDNGGRGGSWKGYIEVDEVEQHVRPSLVWNTVQKPLAGKAADYFSRILALCREEGIPLVVIGFPNPDYANDHMYFNTLLSIAQQNNVPFVNYNDPSLRFGMRFASDFADWQHLNVKGAMNFSMKLGQDLRAAFDLPDRRGDPAFASYDACADLWYEKLPSFATSPQAMAEKAE